jgi:uncharacterized protein (TIGR02172 family)
MEQPSAQPFVYLLPERIDTNNAHELEAALSALFDRCAGGLVLDASQLQYISSAGLRMILKVARRVADVSFVEATSAVYDVLEMSGFTEIIDVRRAMREVSLDGLEMIGAGANGRVFRLDDERILKVYNPLTNTPEKIAREKSVAREAIVWGIPSVLSFEMVRVGDGHGIVYEMIDALTLGETIAKSPERADEYATRMADMLKQLHATEFEEGTLPDARLGLHAWVDVSEKSGYYPPEVIEKARALVDSIPPRNTFVHGDFHPANIMVTDDDELLLIDMGDASVGDPIVDLLGSYQLMCLVASRPGAAELYTGMSSELLARVWNVFVRTYYGTDDDQEIARIEQRLKFYAIIRSMAGITFSSVLTDEERRETADQIMAAFLHGWDTFVKVAQ